MPERPDELARRIAHDEINDEARDLDMGLRDTERRTKFKRFLRASEEQFNRREARNNGIRAFLAGQAYTLGTVIFGAVGGWLLGLWPWIGSLLTPRKYGAMLYFDYPTNERRNGGEL